MSPPSSEHPDDSLASSFVSVNHNSNDSLHNSVDHDHFHSATSSSSSDNETTSSMPKSPTAHSVHSTESTNGPSKAPTKAPAQNGTRPTPSSSAPSTKRPSRSRQLSSLYSHKSEWPDGKRPKGFRTAEGKEAALRSQNSKTGVSIPHLSANCNTYQGVFKHALLGAIRSGGVTYGMKALVNLCLGMLKLMKGKGSFAQIFKESFFGMDAIRFGTFFSSFSFLWKFVNNGLKLYRGKDDRVNGAIAGAIAGLAILVESKERRVTFAQQMFVRAGQGVYNAGKHRGVFSFRHGDAALFALACGQVLYAYTMQPESIPPEYLKFMVNTARVPVEALAFNRARIRGFPVDVSQVQAMVKRFRPTPKAIETASKLTEFTDIIPCAVLHPSYDSCTYNNAERFYQVTRNILPVYATLNFVPLLVLRMKRLLADPFNVMFKTSFNTLRSSVFLAVFVAVYQSQICFHRNLVKDGWMISNNKYFYWLFGVTCSASAIMVEQESRRAELAMYVLPKAAESLYKILYQKNWVKGVKHWEVLMFSTAMSLIMSFYQQEEQVLSPFVTKLIYHILGRN
ncbi:hypothetical protein BGW38_005026 [Lunasporangiospora selenospora]|uniref:Transmembrane protein 135 N-terminal domain-containing protein n=1 Tax=Lunasporangiospora selenospora TaxID=979761 RepID=A0A9P6KBM4_9FUNG|nr:hypothetical protein BGW38_005026 [Lunasporangiospora selenospora]